MDVGLHLDWTSAFAVAAGHGQPLPALMARAALGGLRANAVRTAVERQLDAFEAQWQAPPDHIDGHQHVQQFRGIREALVEAVQRRYPVQPPWLRVLMCHPAERAGADDPIGAARVREGAYLASAAFAQALADAGVRLARGHLLFTADSV